MLRRTVEDIAHITGAEVLAAPEGARDHKVERIIINSQEISESDKAVLFLAFKGEKTDANQFALQALKNGALGVVLTDLPPEELISYAAAHGKYVLRARNDDATAFLLSLAAKERKEHDWFVIGITGSNGKTTTKEMVFETLKDHYKTYMTPGNFNSVIGVPLAIFATPDDTEVFVCEMGMNNPGEIDSIAQAVRPHIAAITNIGTSHIGILGSQDNIARAKAECVAWLAEPLPACINITPRLIMLSADHFTTFIRKHFTKPFKVEMITLGDKRDEISLSGIKLSADGTPSAKLTDGDKAYELHLSVLGEQSLFDAEIAYAIARTLGISQEQIIDKLSSFKAHAMRQSLLKTKKGALVIDDSYNASPASFAYAFKALAALDLKKGGKKIAVIGEMGELGDQAKTLHLQIAKDALSHDFDMYIFVGPDLSKDMVEKAQDNNSRNTIVKRFECGDEALKYIQEVIEPNDAILIKGSRYWELDQLVGEVVSSC